MGILKVMAVFKSRRTSLAIQLRNNATAAERLLWRHLSRRQLDGHKFSGQIPIGRFVADFVCRESRLIVEVDGGQHEVRTQQDLDRTAFLEGEGYRVIRFWNNEVLENIEGVLQEIAAALLVGPPPAPPASGRGEVGAEPFQ